MAIEETLDSYFKAETRSSGLRLQAKVSLSNVSDTAIHAYVRATKSFKVKFLSASIGSELFTVECSCPMGKKSQFCKHIYATLLCVDQKSPDFLAAKRVIEKSDIPVIQENTAKSDFKTQAKERASLYRKVQYQRQKLRVKRGHRNAKVAPELSEYPESVEKALAYFVQNGFVMPSGPSEEMVGLAKRQLSRVFHPDKGGKHAEMIELNEHAEVLLEFLR